MNLKLLEAEARYAVATKSSQRAEAVEQLVAALLSGGLGFSSRATDGFVPIREEMEGTTYFVIGKIFMIDDQSVHPVSLELAFENETGVASGTMHWSMRSEIDGSANNSKLETALFAYPHEMVETLEWAHTFKRGSDGWSL